jgi:fumarate hydratase class II
MTAWDDVAGNFQINTMLSVIAYNLLQSIELLANAARVLAEKAMAGITVNEATLSAALPITRFS